MRTNDKTRRPISLLLPFCPLGPAHVFFVIRPYTLVSPISRAVKSFGITSSQLLPNWSRVQTHGTKRSAVFSHVIALATFACNSMSEPAGHSGILNGGMRWIWKGMTFSRRKYASTKSVANILQRVSNVRTPYKTINKNIQKVCGWLLNIRIYRLV